MISEVQSAELIRAATEARQHAYCPYSGYAVGAALLCQNGKIYKGANIENAVYPLGNCAERTAIFKAVSEGERSFAAIALVTENGGSPCGACRQVLAEFGPQIQVIIATTDGTIRQVLSVSDLLPHAFSAHDLPDEK